MSLSAWMSRSRQAPTTSGRNDLSGDAHQEIYADQVALLYRHATLAYIVLLFCGGALLVVLQTHVDSTLLTTWFLILALHTVGFGFVIRHYRRRRPPVSEARDWGQRYLIGVALAGLIWSAVGILLFPTESVVHQILIAAVLAGVVMSGASFLTAVLPANIIFMTPIALPLMVQFGFQGTTLGVTMALMTLLFTIGMAGATYANHRAILKALRLHRENHVLLQQAVADKEQSEQLNSRLQTAVAERKQAEQALRDANVVLESRVQRRTAKLEQEIADRKASEERLHAMSNYDVLTQLPNRHLLLDRLEHALDQAQQTGHQVALLFLNLDRFKMVNDSLGHAVGDMLLQAVAKRLQASVRMMDTVARLGADEFIILLEGLASEETVANLADKLLQTMAASFLIEGQSLYATCSIGISVYPRDGNNPQTLIKNADTALHRMKAQGRNHFQFYTTDMSDAASERLTLESDLRHALAHDELSLYYQPQLDLGTGEQIGVEALLRWQHPQRGMISPGVLIPLAEETNLITVLDDWVLRTACTQAKIWQDSGLTGLYVAVNLSAGQFLRPDLSTQVANTLAQAGIAATSLKLEITESVLMQDIERAVSSLRELKAMGVMLAVDDFGTGYSSLGYLKRFPLDWLKIDRSFVRDVTHDSDNATIVSAVIALSHSLGLKVVAEGIEEAAELTFLQAQHCDAAQGYYLSHPLPVDEVTAWLQQGPDRVLSFPLPERTVLVVDDDLAMTDLFALFLRRAGYRVLTANDGPEALELLAQHPVSVVLSDYAMPKMSGNIFLRRTRALYPNMVRVMISSRTDVKALADAVNDGAIYRFLFKPVSEERLCETVREAFILAGKDVPAAKAITAIAV